MPAESKDAILSRLKTVRGHLAGIERMVEEGKQCKDILVQLAAARSALTKVEHSILRTYARECVADCLREGEDVSEALEGIIDMVIKFAE